MLKAFSRIVGRPSQPPLEQVMPVVSDVVTRDVVLNNLSANPVVNAQFASNNLQLWEDLGKQYFPDSVKPDHQDPISFFQTQQNVLNLNLLTSAPTDEILAKKQFTVGLLLKSFAQRNPNLPLDQFLRNVELNESTAKLEKEALQVAVSATLEFDKERVHPHNNDLTAVLSTYLEREERVKVMIGQLLSQMGGKVQEWAFKMAALLNYFSVAQIMLTCDAQLVRKVTGEVIAEVAFRGHVKIVELLYPHICDCVHAAADNPDFDTRYCVLEKAAKAQQREVVGYLLTAHGGDFPPEKRVRLLQSMAAENETHIVQFLLTDFRQDFSVGQIFALRGLPGYQSVNLSSWQIFGAPLMARAASFLGIQGGALPPQALAIEGRPSPLAIEGFASASALSPPSLLAIEQSPEGKAERKADGSQKGQRKRLAIEQRQQEGGAVVPLSQTYTPAAAAAAAASSSSLVVPPAPSAMATDPSAGTHEERALVPHTKKRGK